MSSHTGGRLCEELKSLPPRPVAAPCGIPRTEEEVEVSDQRSFSYRVARLDERVPSFASSFRKL